MVEYIPWTPKYSNYKVNENDINQPCEPQALWNYPEADFIYFAGYVKCFSSK